VNAYVVKPVDFHKFVDAVKTLGAFWVVPDAAPIVVPQPLPEAPGTGAAA